MVVIKISMILAIPHQILNLEEQSNLSLWLVAVYDVELSSEVQSKGILQLSYKRSFEILTATSVHLSEMLWTYEVSVLNLSIILWKKTMFYINICAFYGDQFTDISLH